MPEETEFRNPHALKLWARDNKAKLTLDLRKGRLEAWKRGELVAKCHVSEDQAQHFMEYRP